MKNAIKLLCLVIILTNATLLSAQDFYGKATYFSKIKIGDRKIDMKSGEDPQMQKMLEEAIKKASEKTFCLSFNKVESVYEEEQKLEPQGKSASGMAINVSLSRVGKKYMSQKDKKQIFEGDIFGKEFLITDELKQWNWSLKDETKKIGEYLCYKAEAVVKVTNAQKEEYQNYLKKKDKKGTNFMQMEEPLDYTITAWYAIDIPVNHGPDIYAGLPGLILEVNAKDATILCSKIILNSKDKIKIEAPTNGKVISQKDFDRVEKEKMESMMDGNGNVIIKTFKQ
jgi:GLPGLI family protein